MILIDAVYIHNGGGKNIIDNICFQIIKYKKENNFFFLFDSRYDLKTDRINYKKIRSSEFNRLIFYKKNNIRFKRYICMANVPPPINTSKPVDIYFHNELLFDPFNNNLTLINKLILNLKKFYILNRNNKKYAWNVQTDLMKKKLTSYFRINDEKINIYPIFDSYKVDKIAKEPKKFLYVSNFSEHKNHLLLFKAFQIVSNKLKFNIYLDLTLPNEIFQNSFYNKEPISNNLIITNHGILSKSKLSKLYSKSNFLIFPSLNESLGLPLIEAVLNDCYVLSSKKDYVFEIIEPTLTFNPYSVESIVETISEALTSNSLKKSRLIIENKIGSFVKYISNNV